jgi:hypothetical protein
VTTGRTVGELRQPGPETLRSEAPAIRRRLLGDRAADNATYWSGDQGVGPPTDGASSRARACKGCHWAESSARTSG